MSSSQRLTLAAFSFTGTLGGCALLGYNFDGYVATGTGGGQGTTSSLAAGGAGATTGSESSASASSGNGGGASSSSISGSSGASSSSSGMGGMSDCNDCTSPVCLQDHTCADDPPVGWKGPVALYYSDDASFVCPPPFGISVLAGGAEPMGAPASCTPCACDTAPCGMMVVELFSGSMCAPPDTITPLTAGSFCYDVNPTVSAQSVTIPKITANGGCVASGGMASAPPPMGFTKHAALCGSNQVGGVGCNAGSCLPKPPSPLGQRFCIYQTGALMIDCPPGYTQGAVFGSMFKDNRGCSPCTCGPPSSTCDVTVDFKDKTQCGGSSFGTFNADGQCHDLNSMGNVTSMNIATTSPCSPSAVGPIGGLDIPNATVVCCK